MYTSYMHANKRHGKAHRISNNYIIEIIMDIFKETMCIKFLRSCFTHKIRTFIYVCISSLKYWSFHIFYNEYCSGQINLSIRFMIQNVTVVRCEDICICSYVT